MACIGIGCTGLERVNGQKWDGIGPNGLELAGLSYNRCELAGMGWTMPTWAGGGWNRLERVEIW